MSKWTIALVLVAGWVNGAAFVRLWFDYEIRVARRLALNDKESGGE